MKNLIPTYKEFITEEDEWIESVISFKEDSQLTQKIIAKLQQIGVDTGSLKSTYNAESKQREIRVFNKLTSELNNLFDKDEYAGITIKKYEE